MDKIGVKQIPEPKMPNQCAGCTRNRVNSEEHAELEFKLGKDGWKKNSEHRTAAK